VIRWTVGVLPTTSMPRVLRSVVPRIRKSLNERGVLVSPSRAVLLPIHLLREHRAGRKLQRTARSDFDIEYKVDTDGELDDWTDLSDLKIESPNWIFQDDEYSYCIYKAQAPSQAK
jgi:hypothetical protein